MRKFKIILLLTVAAFAAVLIGQTTRAASTLASLQITNMQFVQCGSSVIEGKMRVTATDTSGAIINSSTPVAGVEYYTSPNGSTAPQNNSYLAGVDYGFYISIPPAPLAYLDMYIVSKDNPAIRTDTYRLYCNGSIVNMGGGSSADGYSGADDRINRGAGDLINVLYARYDSNSKPQILVYSLNSASRGVYEGAFSYAKFEPYLNNPPKQNTLIATVDQSKLYALTTGEFQINIYSEAEDKVYTVIFSGLPPKSLYYRTIE